MIKPLFISFALMFGWVAGVFSTPAPQADIPILTFDQLQSRVQKPNDTLYVVNFWATWCKPCVAEMPYFEQANKTFATNKVKVVFVSLDFQNEHERMSKFIAAKGYKSTVYHLNGGNPNDWIDKIDPTWSGAIPTTVFYKGENKLYFREGDFTQAELDSIIKTNIN